MRKIVILSCLCVVFVFIIFGTKANADEVKFFQYPFQKINTNIYNSSGGSGSTDVGTGFTHGINIDDMSNLYLSRIAIYNIWERVGLYWNGHGSEFLSSSYYSHYPGDRLVETQEEESWGSNSFGVTYSISPLFFSYLGYSTGSKNIKTTNTYFDEYKIFSYNGYYDVIYDTSSSEPGIDFGVSYEIIGYDIFGLLVSGGYNTSFEGYTWGIEISTKISTERF